MIKNIGINTDSIYKFITTLSLFSLIYCLSYEDLFLVPHNKIMLNNNIQLVEWDASKLYLSNLSNDLILSLNDSIKKNYTLQSTNYNTDTFPFGKYFNSSLLTGQNKIIADSINLINKEFDILNLKIQMLSSSSQESYRMIKTKRWVSLISGILFGVVFVLSMIAWYTKRKEIDK